MIVLYDWYQDSPFPVPLLKNSSSADRRGRGLSIGMQYLLNFGQLVIRLQKSKAQIPYYMYLIFQFSSSWLLLYEIPNMLQLLNCTWFKTLGVMEDKVTSRVCNLVFNIMYASLKFCCILHRWPCISSVDLPQLMASDVLQMVPILYLKESQFGKQLQKLELGLPSWSYIMGLVPCCTPQTFSRMVVLPALALPMMRMWKWGHLYRSLSFTTGSTPVFISSILVARGKYGHTWYFFTASIQCHHCACTTTEVWMVRSEGRGRQAQWVGYEAGSCCVEFEKAADVYRFIETRIQGKWQSA